MRQVSHWMQAIALSLLLLVEAHAGQFVNLSVNGIGTLQTYVHIEPHTFDSRRVVLAFPPGAQHRGSVEFGLATWLSNLRDAGWTVISPAAPDKRLFVGPNLVWVPHLLEAMRKTYSIQFERVSVFGISNGGISALEAAARYPHLFHNVTVAPGLLLTDSRACKLSGVAVSLIVGEHDALWRDGAQTLAQQLDACGVEATLDVIPNGDHFAFQRIPFEMLHDKFLRRQ